MVCESSKSSDQTTRVRLLVLSFVGHLCWLIAHLILQSKACSLFTLKLLPSFRPVQPAKTKISQSSRRIRNYAVCLKASQEQRL